MTVWRYIAIPAGNAGGTGRQTGELAADSAAEVRASLRRIGLQVIDVRPLRAARDRAGAAEGAASSGLVALRSAVRWNLEDYVRRRRRPLRAEYFDSLATMLASGLPMLEAVETILASAAGGRSALRSMLVQMREGLRSGSSLGQAMGEQARWFDPTEVAMVRAGQHGGTLPDVLRSLADRHERGSELTQKLIGALAYPAVVATVGVGVVVFISVKTLPDLVQILTESGIETPALTARMMGFGQFLAHHWGFVAGGGAILLIGAAALRASASRRGIRLPGWVARLSPRVLRRIAVSRVAIQLAELLRTGVPMVDALRVLAPTSAGLALRRRLLEAADRVERGEELSRALDDPHWFDAEFRQLLDIGQSSGELDVLLERIGRRYARRASRRIDRLATLLEPMVILALAGLVGTVVIAALLPLLQMREML